MNISERLTEEKLLEILTESYLKGNQNESIRVLDLLEEIKLKVMEAMNSNE